MLTRAYNAVYDWFFGPADVHALVLSRIILGGLMLACYLLWGPYMSWYYGQDGLLTYLLHMDPGDLPVTQQHMWPIFGALVLCAAAFMLGLFTRVSGVGLALCHWLFIRQGIFHSWGWSETVTLPILYVAFSGANRWLAVDAWLRTRRGIALPEQAPAWAMRLFQFHVSMIYVAAAWHRIDDVGWIRGEMVYEAMTNGWYSRLPYVDFRPMQPVLALLTWGTELLELSAPLGLWWRRSRHWYVLGLAGMHTGLHLGASVGMWQPMMIAGLISFADPQLVRRLLTRKKAG